MSIIKKRTPGSPPIAIRAEPVSGACPLGGTALLVTDDEHFHAFGFDSVEQLAREAEELGHSTAFVSRRPVMRIALDGGDDGEKFVEEAIAQAFGSVFVVAPSVVEVLLDELVIHHLHFLRL